MSITGAQAVRNIIRATGSVQNRAAEILGVFKQSLSRKIGADSITFTEVAKIAEGLGADLKVFYNGNIVVGEDNISDLLRVYLSKKMTPIKSTQNDDDGTVTEVFVRNSDKKYVLVTYGPNGIDFAEIDAKDVTESMK